VTRRNRLVSALLIGATVTLGLGSRKFAALLPGWMAKNAGVFCFAIEFVTIPRP